MVFISILLTLLLFSRIYKMKIKNDFNNQTETVKRGLGQVSNLKEINRQYGYSVKHGIVADQKTGQFYKQNTFIIDKDKY